MAENPDTELIAYLDGERIGRFTQNRHGAIQFQYDDDVAADATPLSIAMPLVPGARYGNRMARPFLQGLLTDNPETLSALAATHHTSPGNTMGLLRHLGRDTAGALQLLPPGVDSDDAAERFGDITWISDLDELIADVVSEASDWVRNRDDIRWSLAGAQPKLALYRSEDGRWGVPRDSTPTTHILKPAASGSRHDVNEFLTMRAARHLGLEVADHDIFTTGRGDHVFLARRYDRIIIDGRLRRLHQEDFAQALSVEPAYKYQTDGGPGISDFARVLDGLPVGSQQRARDALFDALVFTVAAVNTDGHAKNYSIVHFRGQMRLAPLYDLGSNALYRGESPVTSAVTLGGERLMSRIGQRAFARVASTLRVDSARAESAVERITAGVAGAYRAARADLPSDNRASGYADNLVEAIAQHARARGWAS